MPKFAPEPRSSRPARVVIAVALTIGAVVATALTVLFTPREESFESCVRREMQWQPQVNLSRVQRVCAKRLGDNVAH
jgi:hypothetical protein